MGTSQGMLELQARQKESDAKDKDNANTAHFKKYKWALLACLSMFYFCHNLLECIIGPTLLELSQNLRVEYHVISWAVAAKGIGMFIGAPVGGVAAHYFPFWAELFLATSAGIVTIATIAIPYCSSAASLGVMFCLQGFGIYIGTAVFCSYIITVWGGESGGPFNWCLAAGGIGRLLAPVIAGQFLQPVIHEAVSITRNDNLTLSLDNSSSSTREVPTSRIQYTFIICGMCPLITCTAFLMTYIIMKPSRQLTQEECAKANASKNISKAIYVQSKVFVCSTCIGFFIYFFMLNFSVQGQATFLFSIAVLSDLHFSTFEATFLNTAMNTASLVARLLTVPLLRVVSIKKLIHCYLLPGAIIDILMAILALKAHIIMWILTILFSFSLAPLYACGFVYANEYIHVTGLFAGAMQVGLSLGYTVGLLGFGSAMDWLGPKVELLLMALAQVSCLLVTISILLAGRCVGDLGDKDNEERPLVQETAK